MKGFKLCLIGLGIMIAGGAFVASTNCILFTPPGGALACLVGLIVMILGYRKED